MVILTANDTGVQRPHPGERPGVVRCNDGLADRLQMSRLVEAAQRRWTD